MLDLRGTNAMRKRAECAMCRGMRITTDNCHARKRCALFRTNNVNNTLTNVVHVHLENAELVAIVVERRHLNLRDGV